MWRSAPGRLDANINQPPPAADRINETQIWPETRSKERYFSFIIARQGKLGVVGNRFYTRNGYWAPF